MAAGKFLRLRRVRMAPGRCLLGVIVGMVVMRMAMIMAVMMIVVVMRVRLRPQQN
jgi:hypothetical protein